jgi:hypothetical protein
VVALVDPQSLVKLEQAGFALARLLVESSARTTEELRRLPGFASVFRVLDADIREAARPHPLARVTSIDGFRLFDARWLASPEMTFALVGVVNRLDRRPFYPGSCGEIRFVYRLAYATTQGGAPLESRLPLTLNVVFLVDDAGDPDCRRAAEAWSAPSGPDVDVGAWLVREGALGAEARQRWSLKSLEANLQTFRLQSSVLPSLAGHIEYDLRVFHAEDATRRAFAPAPMESMPDVPRLLRTPSARRALLEELRRPETLKELERGTLVLPDTFLATRATSFSPRGLSRRANRPFATLFTEADFAGLDLSPFGTIASPAALLRRLDAASCTGCHQSRSIAGFHLVGADSAETPTFDALLSGLSSHLAADLARRARYVAAVASGRTPDEFRPQPERQAGGDGFGAPCGLGDAGFRSWTCAAGLRCEKLEDPQVGTCLPAESELGSPCEYGSIVPGKVPYRDQVRDEKAGACFAHAQCNTNFHGVSARGLRSRLLTTFGDRFLQRFSRRRRLSKLLACADRIRDLRRALRFSGTSPRLQRRRALPPRLRLRADEHGAGRRVPATLLRVSAALGRLPDPRLTRTLSLANQGKTRAP